MKKYISIEEKALIKAAKIICDLNSGRCPMHEPDFSGCPHNCSEDIRPWQCWVAYLITHVRAQERTQSKPALRRVA